MNRVSVIIPVYNGENTIAAAIESALAQHFDGFEVIVVDDGSVDSTPDIAMKYSTRIVYLRQPNCGPSMARNTGAAAANGKYLAFLDADDRWMQTRLARTIAPLERNSMAVASFCTYVAHQADGVRKLNRYPARNPTLQDLLNVQFTILTSTVTVRRVSFNRCGGFPFELRGPGFEDLYLWLLLREQGEFEYVDETLVDYSSSPFLLRSRKYDLLRETFVKMVQLRYGKAAHRLIAETSIGVATVLLQEALADLDRGNPAAAARNLAKLVRIKPSFLLQPEIAAQFFRPANVMRLLKAAIPSAFAR